MENKTEIQLIIKAPNQNIADQTINCSPDWSIHDLKNHLSEVYPSTPAVNEQKLIYCGHLLPDELHLNDILRQEGDGETAIQTIHLVCSKQGNSSGQISQASASNSSQNVPSSSSSVEVSNAVDNGLRHRHVESNNLCTSDASKVVTGPSPVLLNVGGLNQMMYMQQLFAAYSSQQYPVSNAPFELPMESPTPVQYNMASQMAAYQQLYTNYYAQMMSNQAIGNATHISTSATPAPENVNMPAPAAQVPPPIRNVHFNGQAMADNHDDGENRDWLDYFYFLCRGFLLFSIVYYYSSPERLFLVVCLALMAFLYQEGWLIARNQRNRLNENQPNRQRQQEPNENPTTEDGAPQNDGLTERDIEEITEIEAAMDGDNPPHMQERDPTNNQNPALTFIMSFFSSLIPDPPPPVNIN